MRIILLTLTFAFLPACSEKPVSRSGPVGAPVVAAVNYPLATFSEILASGNVEVLFPELEGDPAFWKLSDEEIARFQSANLILRNGATYAKWTKTVSLPESTQIDTSKAFSGDFIAEETSVSHTHGDGDSHTHAGTASTTWLDFQQAIWQLEAVRDALIELAPSDEKGIRDRFNKLADEMDKWHTQMREIGNTLNDRPILASHPVYQYLARRYDLNIKYLHWEPDTELSGENLEELKELISRHPASVMLWEQTPPSESIEKLKSLGIDSVVFDPCGNRPDTGDFLTVMQENIKRLDAVSGN